MGQWTGKDGEGKRRFVSYSNDVNKSARTRVRVQGLLRYVWRSLSDSYAEVDDVFAGDIRKRTVTYRERVTYVRYSATLEPAFACKTTHKLQGATAKYWGLIEASANKPLSRETDYVAASRPAVLCKLSLLSLLTNSHLKAFQKK